MDASTWSVGPSTPFASPPFGVTPDVRMVYPYAKFQEARAALLSALSEGKGFVVITGEVGAGKTTLLRTILADTPKDLVCAAILNTGLSPDEILRAVAEDLEIPIGPDAGRKAVVDRIQDRLLETYAQGKKTAIFVDEAQHLSEESLECLRMLSNLETEAEKLVQIALFGQGELRDRLALPSLRQLRSRIAVHRHLVPLTRAEVEAYMVHRMGIAAPSVAITFEPRSIREVHLRSAGLPRRVNLIADLAIQKALARTGPGAPVRVELRDVRGAGKELASLDPDVFQAFVASRSRAYSTAAAWGVLLSVVVYLGLVRAGYAPRAAAPRDFVSSAAPLLPPPLPLPPPPPPDGAALADLFSLAGTDAPYPPAALARMRPEAAAVAAGFDWLEIRPDPALLRGIGLPTFVVLRRLDGGIEAAVVRPDTLGAQVRTPGAPANVIPWEGLEPADRPAGMLLPRGTWKGVHMTIGATGPEVLALEESLARLGYFSLRPNLRFGPGTRKAVAAFQAARGIPEDGVVGPLTTAALFSAERLPSP